MAILQDLNAEMKAELEALRAENARLKAGKANNGMKYTEKGGVSVYGMGRFPVTLYASQWDQLWDRQDEIKAFVAEGIKQHKVKVKGTD